MSTAVREVKNYDQIAIANEIESVMGLLASDALGLRHYQAGRWRLVEPGMVQRAIIEICEQVRKRGDKVPLSDNFVVGTYRLLEKRRFLPSDEWAQGDRYLAFAGATLDIESIEALPHDPEHLARYGVDYDYDPSADCPEWRAFVEDRLGDAAGLFQEYVGYSLTTDTRHELAVWLVGPSGCGKSTLLHGVRAALGSDICTTLGLANIEQSQFALANVVGKRLLLASEQPAGYTRASHVLNALISGEELTIERKYHAPFEYKPCAKIIWAMNEEPRLPATSGLYRRLAILQVPAIDDDARDLTLRERFTRERAGIMNWALEGLAVLRARGWFEVPETVRQAVREYQLENDQVAQFLAEACIVLADTEYPASKLYQAYVEWSKNSGHGVMSQTAFGREMGRLGYQKKRKASGYYYQDIGPLTNY